MSKITAATRLADEFGVSVSKAGQFINDVGLSRAQSLADEAAQAGSRTVSNWWRPAAAGSVLAGGGALAWRQQDVERARQIANQQEDYSSTVASIMDSDLPPSVKQDMVDDLTSNGPTSGGDGGGGGGDGGPLSFLTGGGGPLGQLQTVLVLLVVTVLVLQYADGGD